MKKVIALFGSLLVLATAKTKAQQPQQPVKKETVKPTGGTSPNPGANPAYLKGANPIIIKGASSAPKPAARRTRG